MKRSGPLEANHLKFVNIRRAILKLVCVFRSFQLSKQSHPRSDLWANLFRYIAIFKGPQRLSFSLFHTTLILF